MAITSCASHEESAGACGPGALSSFTKRELQWGSPASPAVVTRAEADAHTRAVVAGVAVAAVVAGIAVTVAAVAPRPVVAAVVAPVAAVAHATAVVAAAVVAAIAAPA